MIYADHAATTKISETAKLAMLSAMEKDWYNSSSLYTPGQQASGTLMDARVRIAHCLGCLPKEIYFTSGGSEADNQAILSAAAIGKRQGKMHIISTAFEHHAVLHTLKKLEKEGFEITLLDVGEKGIVSPAQVEKAIRPIMRLEPFSQFVKLVRYVGKTVYYFTPMWYRQQVIFPLM